MKRQARECYLARLQRYGEDPETIMGSWHPDFRELMKRLRDRQLTLMARLTVLEVDVYNAMIKNYTAVIKQLGDMLPQAPPAEDELTQFLKGGGGGAR